MLITVTYSRLTTLYPSSVIEMVIIKLQNTYLLRYALPKIWEHNQMSGVRSGVSPCWQPNTFRFPLMFVANKLVRLLVSYTRGGQPINHIVEYGRRRGCYHTLLIGNGCCQSTLGGRPPKGYCHSTNQNTVFVLWQQLGRVIVAKVPMGDWLTNCFLPDPAKVLWKQAEPAQPIKRHKR